MAEQWIEELEAAMRYKIQTYESKKRQSKVGLTQERDLWRASKYCLNEKEITANNIHINKAETILKDNPLSFP